MDLSFLDNIGRNLLLRGNMRMLENCEVVSEDESQAQQVPTASPQRHAAKTMRLAVKTPPTATPPTATAASAKKKQAQVQARQGSVLAVDCDSEDAMAAAPTPALPAGYLHTARSSAAPCAMPDDLPRKVEATQTSTSTSTRTKTSVRSCARHKAVKEGKSKEEASEIAAFAVDQAIKAGTTVLDPKAVVKTRKRCGGASGSNTAGGAASNGNVTASPAATGAEADAADALSPAKQPKKKKKKTKADDTKPKTPAQLEYSARIKQCMATLRASGAVPTLTAASKMAAEIAKTQRQT